MDGQARQDEGGDERTPLLGRALDGIQQEGGNGKPHLVDFTKNDPENPRAWSRRKKWANVTVIALMAILTPLASSMFTPGINEMAKDLGTKQESIVAATTGFVVTMGLGPMVLAPLSETFGRRTLYLSCFTIFTLLQIPTALSPNYQTLVACRTLSGFVGSVGIANGGGTLNDMFDPSERAGVFGWYLLGPLLGPTIGPLLGGIVVHFLHWRWVFWILTVVCAVNTLLGILFLRESFAPAILAQRCAALEKAYGGLYTYPGHDGRVLWKKVLVSMQRPLKILFFQPVVFTMACYQAVIFATMYSIFTNLQNIFGPEKYNFNLWQIGCVYIGPGLGFLLAVWFVVPRIDTVFNKLTAQNDGVQKPEFRLPLANIGAVLLPVSLFWFGWTAEFQVHWIVPVIAMVVYGFGQIAIFNTVQNYYIDAFPQYAASAIAAGAMFRALVGGIVPLFVPEMFRQLGYGVGFSVFGAVTVALAPSPVLFMRFGERIRKRFVVHL